MRSEINASEGAVKVCEIRKIPRHSREGGNPQFPRTREFNVPLPNAQEKYSVIPAKAGIHSTRHSREGGNPQFPRTREFIVPLPNAQEKHSVIPAKAGMMYLFYSIPGIWAMDSRNGWNGMNSCMCGNDVMVLCGYDVSGQSGRCSRFPFSLNSRMRGNCGFPPSRE